MKVIIDRNSIATITMTSDELQVLRSALYEGVQKLISSASFHKRMKSINAKSAQKDAKDATAVNKALEAAVQKYCRTPIKN